MDKNAKLSKLYVKYVIKTPIIFYLFLLVGIILFLYMTLSLKLDVLQSFPATISDRKITALTKQIAISDTIYIYSDKNEEIQKFKIEESYIENGCTVFVVDEKLIPQNNIRIDLVFDRQTLFERIFLKAGKS